MDAGVLLCFPAQLCLVQCIEDRVSVSAREARFLARDTVSLTVMFGVCRKIAAMVILSWAVLDICVPSVCAADGQLSPPQGISASAPTTLSLRSAPSPGQGTRDSSAVEDDCFCCSSHVAPAPPFVLASTVRATPLEVSLSERPTEEWTPLLYHPPRS